MVSIQTTRRTAVSTSTLIKRTMGVATAGALMLSSIAPAASAPFVSGAAALKSAASPQVTDVRWRGRWGGPFAAGIIGGLALGAIASAPYGYAPYGYAPYGYGYAPYGYAPSYYGYYGGGYGYYGGGYGYYGKQRPW
jgi:hypothetical protein